MASDSETTHFFHQAAVHGSDDEFLTVVVPFLREGIDAGEPTIAALEPRHAELVRTALPDGALTLLDAAQQYTRPVDTIQSFRELVSAHVADGAGQVRVAGQVPVSTDAASWARWVHYEAALNHVLRDLPLHGMCVFDRRTVPATALPDIDRTHPWHATATDGCVPSTTFEDPATLSIPQRTERTATERELGPPTVDLSSPSPADSRSLATRIGVDAGLTERRVEGLTLAVGETVSNCIRYGRPPTRARVWHAPQRVTVEVTDSGDGPTNPFAGLTPARSDPCAGGLGLWLVHQVCDEVTMYRHRDGFTITVTLDDRS